MLGLIFAVVALGMLGVQASSLAAPPQSPSPAIPAPRIVQRQQSEHELSSRPGALPEALPAQAATPPGRQKLAVGRVTFIRRVSTTGTVTVLSQSYRVGKRHCGLYLQLVVDSGRGWLTAYLNGRMLKRWPYKLRND